MKKIILAAALAFGALFDATAQELHSKFQLTLFPPVSTNGRLAPQYTNDVSLNLLVGVSRNETTLTLGGIANVVAAETTGFQAAGAVNIIEEAEGVQLAGVANVVTEAEGLQAAGLFNFARDDAGWQVAGLFNKADNVLGGTQIGIVNVAFDNDAPIGLVNIIRNGEMGVAVTYNDLGSVSATFRSGGKYTYGILGLGRNTRIDGDDAWTVMAGLGAHINVAKWLRINNEITTETLSGFSGGADGGHSFRTGYSLLPAFHLGEHFELFGGPGIFYQQTKDAAMKDIFVSNPLWDKTTDNGKLRQVVLGWQFGAQFIF